MRAPATLTKLLEQCTPQVHRRRVQAVVSVAAALLSVQRLSVTAIGRGLPGTPKHGIKRVDRLLSNSRLHAERLEFFGAIVKFLLGEKQRPVVLVDWTTVGQGLEGLVAVLPCGGRGIPILVRVVPKSKYGNRNIQRRFLRDLKRILPKRCRPIIVADAGFRSPFMEEVSEILGWDFVIRLRGANCGAYSFKTYEFVPHAQLRSKAGRAPKGLGKWFPYGSPGTGLRVEAHLVVGPQRRAKRGTRNYQQRKAEEPWLLATTLYDEKPRRVVELYALRMRIEEAFRDAKSHRFGWALDDCLTRKARRMEMLLMVASLATVVAHVVGTAAEHAGVTKTLQANTSKRRVLSIFFVGSHVLRSASFSLNRLGLSAALRVLRRHFRKHGLPWRPGWLDPPEGIRWVGA